VSLSDGANILCRGAFSEVTGLEATMKPKAVREGGRNWGEIQLAGPTSFGPVTLKRGITEVADLWAWFDATTRQANYALRYTGRIEVFDPDRPDKPALTWTLSNALPTKFKGPDLSATASAVAVEELQLVHEGLVLERPA
jgi:phage tail-like protein